MLRCDHSPSVSVDQHFSGSFKLCRGRPKLPDPRSRKLTADLAVCIFKEGVSDSSNKFADVGQKVVEEVHERDVARSGELRLEAVCSGRA